MGETIVVMEGIEKHFPGVHALSACKFDLKKGEVHALVGENGAGKSTLMKVLTGVFNKDGGKIIYKGQEVEIHNPKAAQHLGICIIHQELNLMPDLTIAENIFIGREPRKGIPIFLNDSLIYKESQKLLDSMNVKLDAHVKVENLTVAQQQMVEIAKAISFNSEVLIMDEPTAALTEAEIDELFRIISELQQKGVGIIYISHRMEELKKICDRVTVMRDGQYIDTKEMSEVTIEEIIHMMVGREIYVSGQQDVFDESAPVVLKV
ncbi:MAG: sugar ABC transporter ATP-binding protein, partial [Vallitaleaceae bacterium]|nr:sugar ABC transporter ATP-binding protein [Vallitaleaceae bacterium]